MEDSFSDLIQPLQVLINAFWAFERISQFPALYK